MSRKQRKCFHIIYKTTNMITQRFYIGMHSTYNIKDGYMGSGKRLHYSLNKYGRENHKFEILEYCNSREELERRESEIVNIDLINEDLCMNLKPGGLGGWMSCNEKLKTLRKDKEWIKKLKQKIS